MDEAERRAQIANELERVEESARISAASQFALSQQWGTLNIALGAPASGLAAAAGVTALAATTGRIAAGVIALASAALGGVLTVLNASRKANQATGAANAYLEIQTAARQERLIDSAAREIDDARAELSELTARRDEQNKSAAPPNRFAYRRATRGLKDGGQMYQVDIRTEG